MDKSSIFQEPLFRRIVVASTALGLSAMFGSLAALRIGKAARLQFVWHWSIVVVIASAVILNSLFWKAVWEVQKQPGDRSRRNLYLYVMLLIGLGIGSFLYPIRFIEQSYLGGIAQGLVTAVVFLGTLVWLVYQCGKGLARIDETELKRLNQIPESESA